MKDNTNNDNGKEKNNNKINASQLSFCRNYREKSNSNKINIEYLRSRSRTGTWCICSRVEHIHQQVHHLVCSKLVLHLLQQSSLNTHIRLLSTIIGFQVPGRFTPIFNELC